MKKIISYGSVIRFVGEKTQWEVIPMDGHNVAFQDVNGNELQIQSFGLGLMSRMLIAELDGKRLLWEVPIISAENEEEWQHWNVEMFSTFEDAIEYTRLNLNSHWSVDETHVARMKREEVGEEIVPEVKDMKCPICDSDNMHYAKVEKGRDNVGGMKYTHAWSCEECPAIVFEYHDKKDIKNLKKMNYNYCGVLDVGVYIDIAKMPTLGASQSMMKKYGSKGHKIVELVDYGMYKDMIAVEMSHSGVLAYFYPYELVLEGGGNE